jgi:hypothetical protein
MAKMAEKEKVDAYTCLTCNAYFAELKAFREHMKASGHNSWTVSCSELLRLRTLSPRKILLG